jgi:hypothetical protein
MSIAQRYGPYGYGEQNDTDASSRVDWDRVDWGPLQMDCLKDNHQDFGKVDRSLGQNRFRLRNASDASVSHPVSKTGRQAIVMRTWSTYEYKDEDMWSLRSIVAEASLATGGK